MNRTEDKRIDQMESYFESVLTRLAGSTPIPSLFSVSSTGDISNIIESGGFASPIIPIDTQFPCVLVARKEWSYLHRCRL